jgi:hypothetical protein
MTIPEAAFDHFVLDGIQHVKRAVQIDVDHLPPAFEGQLVVVAGVADRPAVNQQVDRTELRARLRDEFIHLFRLRDVAGEGQPLAPAGLDLAQRLGGRPGARSIADRHVRPRAGQLQGHRPSDAPRPPGDEGHTSGEFVVHIK